MGDRANVVVQEVGGGRVFLYTHWYGSDLPQLLAAGLARAAEDGRLSDETYLTRHLALVMGERRALSGIGTHVDDNSYPLLVVNVKEQRVEVEAAGSTSHPGWPNLSLGAHIPIQEFIDTYQGHNDNPEGR